MLLNVSSRPRHPSWLDAVLIPVAAAFRPLAHIFPLGRPRTPSAESTGQTAAAVRVMGRLGLFYVTVIMTFMSALLSAFVAWLFSFVIHVPNYDVHIMLAFVIPFFVTPVFSYLSALSMRDLQRARRRAVDLARRDMLTGLGNRRAFFDTARALAEAPAGSASKGVLYIDIDHFKSINDRYGHEGGDVVLKHFSDLLRASTRSSDLVARIGGEEFVIHAMGIELAGLSAIANGLLARVRATEIEHFGQRIRYTVSIGGALGPATMSIDTLLALADAQLYDVKRNGRDAYLFADARPGTKPAFAEPPPALDQSAA